jgi:hypothetical protein
MARGATRALTAAASVAPESPVPVAAPVSDSDIARRAYAFCIDLARTTPMPEMTRKTDPVCPEVPKRMAVPLSVRTLPPGVPSERHDAGYRERRNLLSRAELVRRIEVEYREMPGLRLTLPQAQRLFALREDICVRVLTNLVDQSLLRRDSGGAYVLNGHRP